MATTLYIDAVRLEHRGNHFHIGLVHLTDGQVLTRQEVVDRIRFGRAVFYPYPRYAQQAKVMVASCPYCSAGDYIKTVADGTTADNLLNLPKF